MTSIFHLKVLFDVAMATNFVAVNCSGDDQEILDAVSSCTKFLNPGTFLEFQGCASLLLHFPLFRDAPIFQIIGAPNNTSGSVRLKESEVRTLLNPAVLKQVEKES